MKNISIFFFLMLAVVCNAFAQPDESAKEPEQKSEFFGECGRNMNFMLGYVPKAEYNSLRITAGLNNIIYKRAGVYTTIEKGLDSNHYAHIFGLSLSLHEKLYMYGGVDLYTKYGLFTNRKYNGVRKDFGICYNPFKNVTLYGGWSSTVKVTFGAGFKIPLGVRSEDEK